MNLANALQSLDVENDEHWTQDGQARLDVLKEMVGSQVTRDDIKEVAPKFTRANNVVTSDKQPDNPFAEDAGKAEKDLEGKSVDGGEEAGETVEVNVTDYDSAKSELQGQLEEAKVKLLRRRRFMILLLLKWMLWLLRKSKQTRLHSVKMLKPFRSRSMTLEFDKLNRLRK